MTLQEKYEQIKKHYDKMVKSDEGFITSISYGIKDVSINEIDKFAKENDKEISYNFLSETFVIKFHIEDSRGFVYITSKKVAPICIHKFTEI